MIKTLLKHIIIETAIDTLFNNLMQNFNAVKIDHFAVGKQFTCITTAVKSNDNELLMTWLYDVTIIEIPVDGYLTVAAEKMKQVTFDIDDLKSAIYKNDDVVTRSDTRRIILIDSIVSIHKIGDPL